MGSKVKKVLHNLEESSTCQAHENNWFALTNEVEHSKITAANQKKPYLAR